MKEKFMDTAAHGLILLGIPVVGIGTIGYAYGNISGWLFSLLISLTFGAGLFLKLKVHQSNPSQDKRSIMSQIKRPLILFFLLWVAFTIFTILIETSRK